MQGDQKWFYLACASMGVMGLYICLDFINKRKIKKHELNDDSRSNLKSNSSSNDNIGKSLLSLSLENISLTSNLGFRNYTNA